MKSLDKLGVRLIQGGMGVGISLGGLAGAVAHEGGMGVISTANIGFRDPLFDKDPAAANASALRAEIKKARALANGLGMVAVNAMVATSNFKEMVVEACESGIDAIIAGAGLPLSLPDYTKAYDVLIAPIVSSGKAARMIMKAWKRHYDRQPDFIVVEGPEAGGHLGFREEDVRQDHAQNIDQIVQDVVEVAGDIPVFAAGGVFDTKDIRRLLDIGAYGVQVATQFIATKECDASQGYKDVIVKAQPEDVMILKSPVGMPGRGLRTPLTQAVEDGQRFRPKKCIRCITTCDPKTTPYCITQALQDAWAGDYEHGLFFCGSNVGKVNKMTTVKAIIDELRTSWEKR